MHNISSMHMNAAAGYKHPLCRAAAHQRCAYDVISEKNLAWIS